MPIVDIQRVDVNGLDPQELFMLDSNVLFWLYAGYPIAPGDKDYVKAQEYSNFVGKLLRNGNRLGASAGNVQEVLNLIERMEFELYKSSGGVLQRKKEFRYDAARRSAVQKKTIAVYDAICEACTVFDLPLTKPILDGFVQDYSGHSYDPVDYFVAEDAAASGRLNYITDDPDFQKDGRLNIYALV